MKRAVYAGSFDPITNGHLWMIKKGVEVFDIPPREIAEISSSFVKGLVGPEGWELVVQRYVPETVFERLRRWYNDRQG